MSFAPLLPFFVLFFSFVALRLSLLYASFLALLTSTLLTGTLFHGVGEVWIHSLNRAFQITYEIGFILLGAFFYLEVAKRAKLLDSVSHLLKQVSPNPIIQALLITFPFELMVEGSSGFGTPLLMVTPLLVALEFSPTLCILLPFINFVPGIPFGALGTPTRIGFPGSNPTAAIFQATLPFIFITPLLTQFLVARKFKLKETLWSLSLSTTYAGAAFFFSKSGPEFGTLIPAFLTLIYGIISAPRFFKNPQTETLTHFRGIAVYGSLLACLWLGKQIWMDQEWSLVPVRIFNPGMVFILFGILILVLHQNIHRLDTLSASFNRGKNTLLVFFCITLTVQEMRNNGSLESLTASLPSFFLNQGTPFLGWMGSTLMGTSTITNLLFSKVIEPSFYPSLAVGSAIGVQLAFQSLLTVKNSVNSHLSEKEIFFKVFPFSVLYVLLCFGFQFMRH